MSDEAQSNTPDFAIQRIYTKDMSFETPNSPAIFKEEWKPDVKLDIDTRSEKLADHTFEVTLSVTVTATVAGKVAFLAEVQQAGIFTIGNIPEANLAHTLGAFCPATLFPYAREAVSSAVVRGSFPQFSMAPVNFDALFASYVQQAQAKAQAEAQVEAASSETH